MASKDVLIFIDTCSLLDSCWDVSRNQVSPNPEKEKTFWESEMKSLVGMGRVIVPYRNYEELTKFANGKKKLDLQRRAAYVLNKLAPFIRQGDVELFGDKNDPFADAILLSIALKMRTEYNMAFITQDRALARDLDRITKFESVRPRSGVQIKIRRIGGSGQIVKFRPGLGEGDSAKSDSSSGRSKEARGKNKDKAAGKVPEPVAIGVELMDDKKKWWEA